jgi:hypothetical protein
MLREAKWNVRRDGRMDGPIYSTFSFNLNFPEETEENREKFISIVSFPTEIWTGWIWIQARPVSVELILLESLIIVFLESLFALGEHYLSLEVVSRQHDLTAYRLYNGRKITAKFAHTISTHWNACVCLFCCRDFNQSSKQF